MAGMELELKYLAWLFAASSNIKTSEQQAKTGQKPLEHDFNANKGGEGEREREMGEREAASCRVAAPEGRKRCGGCGRVVRVEQFI